MKTSDALCPETIYTRKELNEMFGFRDQTIRTGIYKPREHNSVWLFITQIKTRQMTPYHDELSGDNLHWDGQMKGRKDRMIIEHVERQLELIVFWRDNPRQYPNSGFKYEGVFDYVAHSGAHPTRFHLLRSR